MMRLGLLFAAPLLLAANEPAIPPAALEPYIEDGRFDPGDFAWMRGAFPDADPGASEIWSEISEWKRLCLEKAMTELRGKVAAAGYPDAPLIGVSDAPVLCRQAGVPAQIAQFDNFEQFQSELAVAKPVIDSYLFAVDQAEETARPRFDEGLAAHLSFHILREQMVRRALFWGQGYAEDAPPLSPKGQAIAQARLGMEMARLDGIATDWLKQVVEQQGWPTISEVGDAGASNAWLIAQHADHDPLFQLQVLRLMEPLVGKGEASGRNFAYLYDRVMLKLAGRQRYGTQMQCPSGTFEPQPLEQPDIVDEIRNEVGLEPIAEYIAMMTERNGPCTPPPRGRER